MPKSDPEEFADIVFAQLPAGVATKFRRRGLSENTGVPTVVCIPAGGVIDEGERPGRVNISSTQATRPILMRRLDLEWHCHAAADDPRGDFYVAEQLMKATLVAVRNSGHHEVRFSRERWIDQEEGNDGFTNWGAIVMFASTIFFPVYDNPPNGLAVVTGATIQTAIEDS